NIASTNQTGPLLVILRKRNRGEKHSMPNWRRRAMAARFSRFGCAFRQNQTGSSSSASKADDCVTLTTTGLLIPSSRKSSKKNKGGQIAGALVKACLISSSDSFNLSRAVLTTPGLDL